MPKIRFYFVIVALIAGFYVIDKELQAIEADELGREASRAYQEGRALLQDGKAAEAVPKLERAYNLERSRIDYEVTLGEALQESGNLTRAKTMLDDVVDRDPNNGESNLLEARLALQEGHSRVAMANYHRAIYGEWPADARSHRVQARLELIAAIAKQGDRNELLSEVLPLEADAGTDPKMRRRIAELYLDAGSPARAIAKYHELLRANPRDVDSLQGLGSAELAAGDFRGAVTALLAAYRLRPADAALRDRLALSSGLSSLDPTIRQMTSAEKTERTQRILRIASEEAAACAATPAGSASINLQGGIAAAAAELNAKHPDLSNEASEHRLALAEDLWNATPDACRQPGGLQSRELQFLMNKLREAR